jgi:hypothetical protein
LGIDRQVEDDSGPGAADSLRSTPADLPDIPNGPVAPPAAHDSAGPQTPAERFSEYKAKVEAAYRQEAVDRGCDRVREVEQNVVTPAVLRIEAEDPDRALAGFDHRLKGKYRLTEKVTARQLEEQPDLSIGDAFAMVKDAIRYTFQYPEEKYSAGIHADCARLDAAGFERFDRRNTWEREEYKGINSRWREPESGLIFEVQFHTQASFEAKQLTHPAFHVVKWAGEKLDEPRRRMAGELRGDGRGGEAATLGPGMWALRKDQGKLTPGQRGALAQIAVVNKPLSRDT